MPQFLSSIGDSVQMIVAGRARFILCRTRGAVTVTPDDDAHRRALDADLAELARELPQTIAMMRPQAWVVEVTTDTPPRFVIIEQLCGPEGRS